IGVADVADLQLAARGRPQRRDDVVHALVVEVDARDGRGALRMLRFLDDAQDAAANNFGDAVATRVVYLLDQDLRAGRLRAIRLRERANRALEDVVTEDDREAPATSEAPGQPQGLRD